MAVATRVLLGADVDLDFGASPGWRGRQVEIPPVPAQGLARLLLSLQAARMAQWLGDRADPDLWVVILHNLLVAGELRSRLPGLSRGHTALEEGWWELVRQRGMGSDPGAVLLRSLMVPRDRAGLAAEDPLSRPRESIRRWLAVPTAPPPGPPFAPPRVLPLHYALPLPEHPPSAHGGGRGGPPAAGRAALFSIGSSSPSNSRVLVIGPQPPADGALAVEPPPGPAAEQPEDGQDPCLHQEWDSASGAYRPQWCSVYDLPAGSDGAGTTAPLTASARSR